MHAQPSAPDRGFRLSQLIYDTRYRSLTIQVVVFILMMATAWWLIDNTVKNLANMGKNIDFSFLWNRAGYDIAQTLIPYTNDDTHFRASVVGLLANLALPLAEPAGLEKTGVMALLTPLVVGGVWLALRRIRARLH